MAGFEVGSIFAKIGIDVSDVKKKVAEVKSEIERLQKDVQKTLEKIGDPQGLKGLRTAIGRATEGISNAQRSLEDFGKTAKTSAATATKAISQAGQSIQALGRQSNLGNLNQQISQVALNIAQSLPRALIRTTALFTGLGSAATRAFTAVGRAVTAPLRAIQSLFRSITSIRFFLATLGTTAVFKRAGEADNLRTAFDQLSKSIGTLSEVFLKRLRQATRGTVSDLELLRVTNNAILLDVAKTADQFVDLAEAARRLGQATGRSTTQAIEDLSLGIGRQSRLLLDNLGIIVKINQAYEKYALTLGKTASQLTQTEQRFAFQQEVFRAIRERIATLGPDVFTLGQAVQRLGATISNVFTDVAESLVSVESTLAISDLLERNRPRIRSFIRFVRESVDNIVQSLITGFQRLRSGDLKLGDLFDATIGAALRVLVTAISKLVPAVFKFGIALGRAFVRGVIEGTSDLQASVGKAVKGFFFGTGDVIEGETKKIQEALDALGKTLSGEQSLPLRLAAADLNKRVLTTIPALRNAIKAFQNESFIPGERLAPEIKAQNAEIVKQADQLADDLVSFRRKLEDQLRAPELERETRELVQGIVDSVGNIGSELAGVVGKAQSELSKSLATMTGDAEKVEESLEGIESRRRERQRDPLSGIRPLVTDKLVQPLANAVNKAIQLREELILKFGKFIPDSVVKASAIGVQGVISNIDRLGSAVKFLRGVFRPRELEEQAFLDIFNKLQGSLESLEFDRVTAGASAGAQAVAELERAFSGMFRQMSPEQLAKVERLSTQLRGVASAAEAAQAVASLREELEDFGLTEAQIAARRIRRDIGEIRLSDAFQLSGDDIQKELDKISIAEVLKKDTPSVDVELDKLGKSVRKAFEIDDSEGLRRQLDNIIQIKSTIEGIKIPTEGFFGFFGDLFSRQVANAISQLDVIGEKLAASLDAKDAIKKLEASLDEIGDIEPRIRIRLEFEEFEDQVKGLERDLSRIGLRSGEVIAKDIEDRIARIRVDKTIDDIERQIRISSLQGQRERVLKIQGQIEFQELTGGISDSVFSGIVDGFARGEKSAKIWSDIVSNIFRNSMQKVINQLSTTISGALGSVFGKLGLSLGAADFATGLIGIGSAVLVGLRNRSEQTISDFSQQINSSEAIRGVVAGPTNVAIAKVGDQLKAALRTTEILLTRIAVSVERGGGGGTGTGGQFFMTRMTPSTPS